ncbi:MAG: hypothetical protein V6Z82_04775 [Flavobacteriales bacterium]
MRLILYISTIGFLSACCAVHKPILAGEQVVRDSVVVDTKTVLHDTVFVTPKSQVTTYVALSDLGAKPVVKQSKNARIVVKKINDTVFVQAGCDTLALAAKIKEHFIKEFHATVETEIVRQKYIPWWAKILCWAGGAALGFLGFKIAKIFSPFKLPWS